MFFFWLLAPGFFLLYSLYYRWNRCGGVSEIALEELFMCLAVPGKILSIEGTDENDPLFLSGRVDFGGIVKQINLAYVPEAAIGDYVLAHAGFAISVIDEEQASLVFECLRAIDREAAGTEAGGEK
jgi:hydrogenase expression/formation protein HypC